MISGDFFFPWTFLFCLISLYLCSAGSPNSVDVESHMQIWSTSFCLYWKQWWPPGWMASFSSSRKENWSALVSCKTVLSSEDQVTRTASKAPRSPGTAVQMCACGGTVLTRCFRMQAQKDSPSVCSRVTFPPESTKDVMHITCFHPLRKETKEKTPI